MTNANMLQRFYPEVRFGGFTDIDRTVHFYSRVNALVCPEFTVIDFGCGRGERADDPVPFRRELTVLRGKVARVIGTEVDEAGFRNLIIDEFRHLTDARLADFG